MDDLERVKAMVEMLHANLKVPITCKARAAQLRPCAASIRALVAC
jgi:tRNA-dihydrouridine synthase